MTNNLPRQTSWLELRELALRNGMELSEAEARDLLPYYDQQLRWLAQLRHLLRDDVQPATEFAVVGVRDVRE